jgi:hypothetical protein
MTAPLVEVMSFWHNSFDDIVGNSAEELTAAMAEQFGVLALSGGLPDDATLDLKGDEDSVVVLASLKVLASIEQGHRLRADAEKLGFPRNPEFDEKLIRAGPKSLKVAQGLTFVVVGPMQPELEALQKKHDQWLEQQKKKKQKGPAALAAYLDASVPNLSSIVVLARSRKKSMLLTGDARGDRIIAGLEKTGLLRPGKRIHVNVLKVPHHGSAHNVAPDFFERITADHYVFSGDGEHGNPERETVEMLFAARASDPFEIHFTYPLEEIDAARKADWKKEQAKEKKRAAKDKEEGKPGNVKPRKNWSDATQALTAFFRKKKLAPGQKVRIVGRDETPHVIDLLDAFTL